MELNILLNYLIISIVASMVINTILRNYAKKFTLLIDIPDRSRRIHKRPTPLTGGIGIFIALLVSGKLYIDLNNLNGYVPDFTYELSNTWTISLWYGLNPFISSRRKMHTRGIDASIS